MKFFGINIDENKLPSHVAVIMDGNGRWANKRHRERIKGHEKGYQVLKDIIEFNRKLGISFISVYAFSTENWNRPQAEVSFLMDLARKLVEEYTDTLIKNDIRLFITGTEENLSDDLAKILQESVKKTAHCSRYTFNIVFNYGGRKEIVDAAKKMAQDSLEGKINLKDADETTLKNYLYHPDLPDVDLLIRTSGEMRISNFLLWQSSYSEFWFTKKLWPDFKPADLCRAVRDYQNRKRRFGAL